MLDEGFFGMGGASEGFADADGAGDAGAGGEVGVPPGLAGGDLFGAVAFF